MATQAQLDESGSPSHIERLRYDYGGNPLFHAHKRSDPDQRLAAFGGAFQPGSYKPPKTNFANPIPMGLCGFALTTFLLSCVLAGMWEVALGNTFGATALASYGGFLDFHWYQCVPIQVNSVKPAIDFETVNTPGGFDIAKAYGGETPDFYNAFGLYIFGWFIFTFILWLVTIRSTVAFSSLFASVWLSFLCLAIGYIDAQNQPDKMPNVPLTRAGGAFGIIAGFLAWYNALAGIAEPSNSFFLVPVFHFPWSAKAREERRAAEKEQNGHMA